ncbi:MAG: efflux RND transporter periplasmic adaptor subunit [Clostridiales bacterium]|nr:efflux RND transporter periplasmic adaptor subunit [Clostridiales bacterium]
MQKTSQKIHPTGRSVFVDFMHILGYHTIVDPWVGNLKEDNILDKEKDTNVTPETAVTPEKTSKKEGILTYAKNHKAVTVIVLFLVIVTLIRLAGFIGGIANPAVQEQKKISVKTTVAEYGDISATAPLSGRIAAAEEAAIVPMAQGQVTAVHVKVGDYVTKGTLLFEIDKSQVATQYNQAKAAYDLAASSYNNMKILYAEGAISKADFDGIEVNYIASRETFNQVAELYSYYNVTSPIDGYITSLSVSVGNMAGGGMAGSVANTSELKISGTVSEYLVGNLEIGDEVDVHVTALGDNIYKGTITELSPAPALGTLTYPITIVLDNESGDLASGMFAEVDLTTEEVAEAIILPSGAVITKQDKNVVVTLDAENIPTFTEVETGIDNGEFVEIVSGVEKGDIIVIEGQTFVEEGIAVEVIE